MRVVVGIIFAICVLRASAQEDVVYDEIDEIPESDMNSIPKQETIFTEEKIANVTETTQVQRKPFQFDLEHLSLYLYELLAVLGIFIYLWMYQRGIDKNSLVIQRFYRQVQGFCFDNFAHIGFNAKSGEGCFMEESGNETLFYASGRENAQYIEMRFNLRKRQDIIYHWFYEILFPVKDIVIIDVPVTCEVPCVLLVATKKRLKQVTQSSSDVSKLAKAFKISNLNPCYEILGETAETVDYLIDNFAVKRLNEMKGLFLSLHYTDQQIFSESKGHLRATLNLSHNIESQFLSALQLILHIVDRAAVMRISAAGRAAALASRQAYNQSKEKQGLQKHKQQMRKQKEEKLKQEEAWLRSLPPEKQKREDEKRKKKEINKMMKGKTMKVM